MKNPFILLMFLISSCTEYLDENALPYTEKIILGGLMVADSMVSLSILKDNAILDKYNPFDAVKGASVKLYEGDALFATLQETEMFYDNISFTKYITDKKPKPGQSYRLEVEKSGFDKIIAIDKIPNPPVFSIDNVFIEASDYYIDEYTIKFDIKIEDSPEIDYYHLVVKANYKKEVVNLFTSESVKEDFSTELQIDTEVGLLFEYYMWDHALFDDQLFNGEERKFSLQTYNSYIPPLPTKTDDFDPGFKITFELRKISEPVYNFFNSSELQWWVQGDIFAEPVQVYSNIENGGGFFGSYNASFSEVKPEFD